MNDKEKIDYLRKKLRKEREYQALITAVEECFIEGAYVSLYAPEELIRSIAKQQAWIIANQKMKSFYATVRGLIPLYVDLQGQPKMTGA